MCDRNAAGLVPRSQRGASVLGVLFDFQIHFIIIVVIMINQLAHGSTFCSVVVWNRDRSRRRKLTPIDARRS